MVDKVVRSVGAPTAVQAPVAARAPRRKVLIAAAECAPLAKSGGLADVVGALPKYLAPLGTDARVIVPFHRVIKDKHRLQTEHLCDFYVDLGWRHQYVGVEKLMLDGATYYLVDNEFYFGGPIYCGGEFEAEQYAFFTRAVLEAIPRLDFDPQVLHCNDWHTAAMPFLLKTQYAGQPQGGLKTLLTLHNLAYQGSYDHGLLHDLLGIGHEYAGVDQIGHFSQDNLLKAGIRYADAVNTVSPTYAREICTPQFGETLEGVGPRLRRASPPGRHLHGLRPRRQGALQGGPPTRAGPGPEPRGAAHRHGGAPHAPEGHRPGRRRVRPPHGARCAAGDSGQRLPLLRGVVEGG